MVPRKDFMQVVYVEERTLSIGVKQKLEQTDWRPDNQLRSGNGQAQFNWSPKPNVPPDFKVYNPRYEYNM
jgi:hypothetical protein